MGDEDFGKVKKWIQNLVSTFDIGKYQTRVGVVVFSDKPTMAISLNEFDDKEGLLESIQNLRNGLWFILNFVIILIQITIFKSRFFYLMLHKLCNISFV